jgi:hypothetical protein
MISFQFSVKKSPIEFVIPECRMGKWLSTRVFWGQTIPITKKTLIYQI